MSFLEVYKPTLICKALGLEGFETDTLINASDEAIRVLFLPSFHPEACVTVSRVGSDADLQFTGFIGEQLWHTKGTRNIPTFHATRRLSHEDFDNFWKHSKGIWAARQAQKYCVLTDGMRCAFVIKESEKLNVLEENVYAPGTGRELASLCLTLCWKLFDDDECCARLRNLGAYVNLNFPTKATKPSKPRKRIAVFGSSDDSNDLRQLIDGGSANIQS